MATITTRSGKGSPLTNTEVDNNFTNLNTDKVEKSGDTLTGDLAFGDNVKAKFGASDDLRIYHDGTHSYVEDNGIGNLRLKGFNVQVVSSGNETMAVFKPNEGASLWYDNSKKIETTSSGVDVTGTLVADGATIDGNAYINHLDLSTTGDTYQLQIRDTDGNYWARFTESTGVLDLKLRNGGADGDLVLTGHFNGNKLKVEGTGDISFYEDTGTTAKLTWDASAEELQFKDNVKAEFGDGGDFQIYHDGLNSYINDVGSGNLRIRSNGGTGVIIDDGTYILATFDASANNVKLYHNGNQKLETKSTGIDVTGTVTADGLTVENNNDTTINFGNAVDANDGTTINVRKGAFTSSKIQFLRTDDQYNDFEIKVDDAEDVLLTYGQGNVSNDLWFKRSASLTPVLRLKNSGDISFYSDDGTSQDFYWDASTSRLGIKTTNPSYDLHVKGNVNETARMSIQAAERTGSDGASSASLRLETVARGGGANRDTRYEFLMTPNNNYGNAHLTLKYRNDGTNGPDVLNIRPSGDIEFFAQDGTTSDFYWDKSTSRLGLGTTSPEADGLEVANKAGTTAGVTELFVTGNASGKSVLALGDGPNKYVQHIISDHTNNSLQFNTASPTLGGNEAMRIDSSGNVGINNTNPTAKLDVEGTIRARQGGSEFTDLKYYGVEFNRSLSYIRPDTDGTKDLYIGYNGVNKAWRDLLLDADRAIVFNANASEAARINSNGRLGIGTTSPSSRLHIDSETSTEILRIDHYYNGNQPALILNNQSGNALAGSRISFRASDTEECAIAWARGSGGSSYLAFHANESERMRIDSSGRLGLGTTSPARSLHVVGTNITTRLDSTGVNNTIEMVNTTSSSNQIGFTGANFFVSPNGSEAMRIDSSGNLLVGTTDSTLYNSTSDTGIAQLPLGKIEIARSGGTLLTLNRLTSDGTIAEFRKDGSTVGSIGTVFSDLCIGTGDTGIRFWDAGPGIFPVDPSNTFANKDNAIDLGLSSVRWKDLYLSGGLKADTLKFSSLAGSEYGRFDSSGNLLVGGTNAFPSSNNVVGSALKSNGQGQFSRDGGTVLNLNRKTSDGTIAEFRQDGSTVGSIGTYNDQLYIGRDDTGIRFTSGDDALLPVNANSGVIRSGNIDLGKSYGQFRNLYLSGGVYLGGTGSANLLDDYEEGTFTPSAASVTQGPTAGASASYSGRYTKIGRIVHCQVEVFLDSTDAVAIDDRFLVGNLPFAVNSSLLTGVGTGWMYSLFSGGNNAFLSTGVYPNENIAFYVTHIDGSVTYASTIKVEFTYETSA